MKPSDDASGLPDPDARRGDYRSRGNSLVKVAPSVNFTGPDFAAFGRGVPSVAGVSFALREQCSLDLGEAHTSADMDGFTGGIDTDMLAGVEAPKAPPELVAARVIASLAAGQTIVFPDDTSASAGSVYLSDPVKLEHLLAGRSRRRCFVCFSCVVDALPEQCLRRRPSSGQIARNWP